MQEMGRKKRKDVTSLQLTPAARQALKSLASEHRLLIKDVLELSLGWLSRQDPIVRDAILRPVRPRLRDATADAIEQIAKTVRSGAIDGIIVDGDSVTEVPAPPRRPG